MSKKHSAPLAETDPLHLFIQKATQWLLDYFKYILIILCVFIFTGAGFLVYEYQQKHKNQKAENELHVVKKTLVDLEKTAGGNVLSEGDSTVFKKTVKSEYTTEIERAVQQYQQLIKKWRNTSAGLLSAIELSYFLYHYDKQEQAIELLQFVLNSYKKENLARLLSSYQLGLYLIDQKKYDLALTYFDSVIQSNEGEWLQSEALLKKALIYEKQNKRVEAENIYKDIQNNDTESPSSQTAAQYLNFMTLESKLKKDQASDEVLKEEEE